jgi:hypothetical protein
MADLEVVLEYEKDLREIRPEKVLRAATLMLKVIRGIERNLMGKNTKPRVDWRVNVYMLTGRAVIAFDAVGNTPSKQEILGEGRRASPPKVDLAAP